MAAEMVKQGCRPRCQRTKDAKERNAARDRELPAERSNPSNGSHVPTITEDDLLAFQLSHFGDDTKPDTWFVEAQVALDFDPALDLEDEDGLGYYEDGVKRTLTDEQIEMFRHSETEQMIRDGLMVSTDSNEPTAAEIVSDTKIAAPDLSPASSIEEELAKPSQSAPLVRPAAQSTDRQFTPSVHSDISQNSTATKRQRNKEVPYDQRNKRKWEGYVEDIDPVQGSRTHRRIVRELDEQRNEDVELEY